MKQKNKKNKTQKNLERQFVGYIGLWCPCPGNREAPQQGNGDASEQWRVTARKLGRELYHLWNYLGQENLWEEAKEYMEEHAEEPSVFEDF